MSRWPLYMVYAFLMLFAWDAYMHPDKPCPTCWRMREWPYTRCDCLDQNRLYWHGWVAVATNGRTGGVDPRYGMQLAGVRAVMFRWAWWFEQKNMPIPATFDDAQRLYPQVFGRP